MALAAPRKTSWGVTVCMPGGIPRCRGADALEGARRAEPALFLPALRFEALRAGPLLRRAADAFLALFLAMSSSPRDPSRTISCRRRQRNLRSVESNWSGHLQPAQPSRGSRRHVP